MTQAITQPKDLDTVASLAMRGEKTTMTYSVIGWRAWSKQYRTWRQTHSQNHTSIQGRSWRRHGHNGPGSGGLENIPISYHPNMAPGYYWEKFLPPSSCHPTSQVRISVAPARSVLRPARQERLPNPTSSTRPA